jgi:hypothetical protein
MEDLVAVAASPREDKEKEQWHADDAAPVVAATATIEVTPTALELEEASPPPQDAAARLRRVYVEHDDANTKTNSKKRSAEERGPEVPQ